MRQFVLLALAGLAAQLVDGSLGMAYGLTSTTLLLAVGVAPAAASASVHMAEVGTTLVSGFAHWRFGNTDWKTVAWLAVPGGIGAFFGALALSSLAAEAARPAVAVFLLLLGIYVLARFAIFGGRIRIQEGSISERFLAPLGLVAGFLDAAGGGGWGPIATPTLLASGRMQPRKVIGTVDTSEFLVALCASIGFLIALDDVISPMMVGAFLVGGVIAAPIAAWLVRYLHPRILGSAVGGLIIFTNGRTVLSLLGLDGTAQTVVLGGITAVWIAALVWSISIVLRERDRGSGGDATSIVAAPAD